MYNCIGIDVGNEFTKDSNRNIFKTLCTRKEPIGFENNKITIDGTVYYYGIGTGTLDIDRHKSEVNKVCTLASLALVEGNKFNIVVGLPIGQYQSSKEELRETVSTYNKTTVKLNNEAEKIVYIGDVFAFSQGLSALYVADISEDCIIVDVGSRTVDIALVRWENNTPIIVQYNTYYSGTLSLYGKVESAINSEYKLTIKSDEVKGILSKGLYVYGEEKALNFLSDTFRNHFAEMLNDLQLNYPSQTTPFLLMGGGATLLFNALQDRFHDVTTLDDNQFINAIGYKIVGEMIFNV